MSTPAASNCSKGIALLPNGRLVCRSHWLMICSFCAIDLRSNKENEDVNFDAYDRSVEDELKHLYAARKADPPSPPPPNARSNPRNVIDLTRSDENTSNRGPPSQSGYMMLHPGPFTKKLWLGKGRVIPKKFQASPSEHPSTLFEQLPILSGRPFRYRFIRKKDPKEFLIYVHAVFLRKEQRAGCAFTFHSIPSRAPGASVGTISFPLEKESPTENQKRHDPSIERAKLRAVLAALRYRSWAEDGFTSLVIAIDSAYIVDCGTGCIRKWIDKGWKTLSGGNPVKDRDLWECLLGEIEKLDDAGLSVKLWRASDCLTPTNQAFAAAILPVQTSFRDVVEWST